MQVEKHADESWCWEYNEIPLEAKKPNTGIVVKLQ